MDRLPRVHRDRADGSEGAQADQAGGVWQRLAFGCILVPVCYHLGMSTQIAVRLSDELVAFVDEAVVSGAGQSRAAVVTKALERERRRTIAARDAEILARTGPDEELAGLAEYARDLPSRLA